MTTAVSIPVAGGAIPPAPAGVTVHQRQPSAPRPAAPADAPADLPLANLPPHYSAPAVDPAAAAAAAPAAEPHADLSAILAALKSAQPPAPAAAPAEPAKPADVAPTTSNLNVVVGGDPMVQSLAGILQAVPGLDVGRLLDNALTHGDVALIDTRYLAEAGGADAKRLEAVAQGLVQAQLQYEARIEAAVFGKFGGEANWDAAAGYFGKTASPEMRQYVAGMLDSRNPALIEQAANLVLDFVKSQGAHHSPAGLVQAGAGAGGGGAPLTKEQFKLELQKLKPNTPGFEQARGELFARRQAGKSRGM